MVQGSNSALGEYGVMAREGAGARKAVRGRKGLAVAPARASNQALSAGRVAIFVTLAGWLVFVVMTVSFFMMRLVPGGPFDRERMLSVLMHPLLDAAGNRLHLDIGASGGDHEIIGD